MKVKCKVSHEQITKTGFRMFEAGREYDLDVFEGKYFEPAEEPEIKPTKKKKEALNGKDN